MVTVAEIAAYLGVTPGAVRQVISRRGIKAKGRRSRYKLYDAVEVLRHTGHHYRSESERRSCTIKGCAALAMARGWCSTHYGRWRRTGDPLRVDGLGTSGVISYAGAHDRVRQVHGRASNHVCVQCGEKAIDWAYTHEDLREMTRGQEVYSLDPDQYVPMCRTHHTLSDVAHRAQVVSQ